MQQQVSKLTDDGLREIASAGSASELAATKHKYLGKSGFLSELMRGMRDVEPAMRPEIGKILAEARETLETHFDAKNKTLRSEELNSKLEREKIDISIGDSAEIGSLHPLNVQMNKFISYFVSMGFDVTDGPEIESDYYNFQALNLPLDHPAREMQDTFFISSKTLLRTQTSAAQVRYMEKHKPPIKMISPGRVFRNDDDATHSPVFHQFEGLVVDKCITMCDLKGTLDLFLKFAFGKDTEVRFRPSYFPFTEPSVEVDATCAMCRGKGCKICKGTGWIEILGAGMVNRNVLFASGINPDKYSGFAFGFGVDRITNLINKIPHIKLLYENDIRFLKQF